MTTDSSALLSAIRHLHSAHILCVGDVMLDRFIYGDVERISPEAPIPVIRVKTETAMLGGAGNVVRNLAALGSQATFIAAIGADEAGEKIAALFQDHHQVSAHLAIDPRRHTTLKTRFIAGGQQLLRADHEEALPSLSDTTRAEILEHARTLIPNIDVLILSDYGKGVLNQTTLPALIALARAHRKTIVIDPKGKDYSIYRGADLLTPNRKELQEATALPVETDEHIVTAARSLIEQHDIGMILVTRSQDGMTLVTKDGPPHHLKAQAREVFDVSGAGDTVVATLAACMALGIAVEDAAQLANLAAGIVVGKAGTAVVYTSELSAALSTNTPTSHQDKILDWRQLQERALQWQRKGLKVGFTNGCFDLLHPGHISLIEQARAACDRLVIGLNSDCSVQKLKGPSRPVQSEQARATVLAALKAVDAVTFFQEETPLALIQTLRPDLLVKGADYSIDKVVGADIVQSYGGKVMLADLKDGFSTTSTIARMNSKPSLASVE